MSLHRPFIRLGLALIAFWCAGAGSGAFAAFPEKPAMEHRMKTFMRTRKSKTSLIQR